MSDLPQYMFLGVILIFLVLFVYIKIVYPFWNIQPVFHTYDFWRCYATRPYQIQYGHPLKTKYTDVLNMNVKTSPFLDTSANQIAEFVDVLQCHSILSEHVMNIIHEKTVNSYLTGHSKPAYLSGYYDHAYSMQVDPSTNMTMVVDTPRMVGCMSSRPMRMFLQDTYGELHSETVYYMDHICVNREFSSANSKTTSSRTNATNIRRKLIQTHEYWQRFGTPEVPFSLLKQEGDPWKGIVPFVNFKISTFTLNSVKNPPLPPHFTVVRVYKENMDLLSDVLFEISRNGSTSPFTAAVFPELGSLTELIQSNVWYIYALLCNRDVYGLYFLKDTKIIYEDIGEKGEGNLIECFASLSNMVANQASNAVFFSGFLNTLYQIHNLGHKRFRVIAFHEIAHNDRLLERWMWKYSPMFETQSAYYLYNMVCPRTPMDPRKCLMIL